jgi:aminoglycoside phosphotransferase (APT) family kinase protein
MIRASGMSGPAVPGPSPDEAVMACARIAAALHRSSIPVGEPRTLAEEVDGAREAVEALAPLSPALALTLHGSLGAIGDLVADPPGPLGVAHGDFDHSQVLFDGPTTGLVDFDAVCRAEPALDLGSFTARLAVAVRRAPDAARAVHDGGGDLGGVFLREYVRVRGTEDPGVLLARVEAYRTVALVRLAVRSWCQLKPQRLRPVLALLDEPPRIPSRVP